MNIVIIGIGKVGSTVAAYLSRENHEVTIVDKNPDVVERMTTNYDVLGVCGNGASPEVQREANMAKAHLVLSLTSSDEFNILFFYHANNIFLCIAAHENCSFP